MAAIIVFDLDGTLLDSDEALARPFVQLGVDRADITFGHVVADECDRLGISLAAYLDAYDVSAALPFPGIDDLLVGLDRWAVCSNKHPRPGRAELARLGWQPEVALFSDAFDGPKRLPLVLDALGVAGSDVVFVGDTAHDRACAAEVGSRFVLAAWNPRAVAGPGDLVARRPGEIAELIG